MRKRKTFVSSIIIVIIIITITTAATTMTYYPCYYVATWHFKADPALYFPAASGWAGHRFGILFWDNSEAVTVSSPCGGKALGMRPSRSIATSEEVLTSVSCPRHPLLRPSLSLCVTFLPREWSGFWGDTGDDLRVLRHTGSFSLWSPFTSFLKQSFFTCGWMAAQCQGGPKVLIVTQSSCIKCICIELFWIRILSPLPLRTPIALRCKLAALHTLEAMSLHKKEFFSPVVCLRANRSCSTYPVKKEFTGFHSESPRWSLLIIVVLAWVPLLS